MTNKTTIIEDKNYKGLYYHPTRDKTDYLLSFLADNDKIYKFFDVTVIGSIPFKSEVADNNTPKITPQHFIENKKFTQILHQVIAENVYSDVQLQGLAKYHQNGWLHVADARDPAPWGRIPYPEDIFGMIQVIDGQIVRGTYQPMPTHRMVTAKGLFMLNDPLQEKLLEKVGHDLIDLIIGVVQIKPYVMLSLIMALNGALAVLWLLRKNIQTNKRVKLDL
ncbi:9467_t:CDS:2 [Funneliformis caledonium]|uniref:9467_t:CDS:1 n=1 Tax=Funneliformis caledonium TaxID=1117310 RepID=A0A9N8WNE4_9GLOM|nr:9467_t:CDS:2 [Funneliformis caledonium]